MAFFKRRLGVIALVPRRPNTTVSVRIGDKGLRWLFDQSNPSSLVRYWKDSTNGHVDIRDVTVSGWHIVESDDAYNRIHYEDVSQDKDRHVAQAACDVAREFGIDVTSYDGLLFFIGGFGVNGGQKDVVVEDRVIPAAIFDDLQTFGFMAHEIGHVLGCDHAFRQTCQSDTYLHGEYGDPTCIMSAMTFGGFGHVAPPLDIDPDADISSAAALWKHSGPGPAIATVWRYLAEFPQMPHWAKSLPVDPKPTTLDLYSTASGASGARLIVLPTGQTSPSYYTIEFRPAKAWDRGLRFTHGVTHETTAAPGVVIHQITDIGKPSDGKSWPKLQCVDYVATVPVPSVGNQDWTCPVFGVRVLEVDHDEDWVRIQVASRLPKVHEAKLAVDSKAGRSVRSPDGPVTLQWTGLKCAPGTFTADYVDRSQTIIVDVQATGFVEPSFSFTVNATPVPVISDLALDTKRGTIAVTAHVNRPTGWGTAVAGHENIKLSYSIGANRLVLNLPRGSGEVTLDVVGTATENAPEQAAVTASAATSASITTRSVELSREALEALRACHAATVHQVRKAFPHGKIPKSALIPIPKHWGEIPPGGLPLAIGSIARLSKADPLQGQIELRRAAKELGVAFPEVALLAKEIGRYLGK